MATAKNRQRVRSGSVVRSGWWRIRKGRASDRIGGGRSLFEEDATPGVHDMLDRRLRPSHYEGFGVRGWHPSCQENLERAMAELGHERIEIPQPINLFMNIPVREGGELGWEPAPTKAGDQVVMRAEMDLLLVVSACPQDIVPINDKHPTAVAIELLD